MTKERITVNKVRTLGEERPDKVSLATAEATPAGAMQALKEEFDRVLAMKNKLFAESKVGGNEKGRAPVGADEKIRGMVASLEGMSRFAMRLGLITPAENRGLFADAMARGLYEGWKK